uniref:Uncharacterized protein n=1 Tax=Hyaloperonospora arabidopsidis (strain Emoy2) TaxID=559515 RepID=M4BJ86_HYAAE
MEGESVVEEGQKYVWVALMALICDCHEKDFAAVLWIQVAWLQQGYYCERRGRRFYLHPRAEGRQSYAIRWLSCSKIISRYALNHLHAASSRLYLLLQTLKRSH